MIERERHWFEDVADHLGSAYLRYSFTKGTEQEVEFLFDALRLTPGQRLLDIGCGPGRHSHALARRGIEVVGIDVSERFIELAEAGALPGAAFRRLDARRLDYTDEFDAALSLCQGAFGLVGAGPDLDILEGARRALRPGGRFALSAFSAFFQVRVIEDPAEFDAGSGTAHETMVIKNENGEEASADGWTTCYTPRELRLLAANAGLEVEDIWSVEPGKYARTPPSIETPEFLMIARRPTGGNARE